MSIPKIKYLASTSVCAVVLMGFINTGEAEVIRPDKWKYHIINPTPTEFMREMSTDRPDQTESPYTVDAGHFQIEASFFDYTYDKADSVGFEQWNIVPINFKVGLLNNVDLQVVLDNYIAQRTVDTSDDSVTKSEGFGDVTTRVKINLWGNDEGNTALALMPFIKAPTNSGGVENDAVEGGIIIPFAVELPADWSMGMMTEYDIMRNEADNGKHIEFVNSITFSRNIFDKLGGYVEFFTRTSEENPDEWQGMVDAGLTYKLMDNIQLDWGCNFGVTDSADDYNPFAGISVRF